MTLVVAQMHSEGLTVVADTMITFANDETRTNAVFENALPKRSSSCAATCASPSPVTIRRALCQFWWRTVQRPVIRCWRSRLTWGTLISWLHRSSQLRP